MTSLLFRKWTIAIILSLGTETKRYSALHRSLPGVTQKVLTEHLKKLERAGIIRCFFYPTIPPRVEYKLTKTGLELPTTRNTQLLCCNDYNLRFFSISSNTSRCRNFACFCLRLLRRSIRPKRHKNPSKQNERGSDQTKQHLYRWIIHVCDFPNALHRTNKR